MAGTNEPHQDCMIRAELNSSQHQRATILIRNVSKHSIAASIDGVSPKIGEPVSIVLSDSHTADGEVSSVRDNYFVVDLASEWQPEMMAKLAQHTKEFLEVEGDFQIVPRRDIGGTKPDPQDIHKI